MSKNESILREHLLTNRKEKKIRFVFDIETLQYNEKSGREKPSEYKNIIYSFAVGYLDEENEIQVLVFNTSQEFFNIIIETYKKWKRVPKIELVAHNNNKYDNHFLNFELKYFFNLRTENLYLNMATDEGNILSIKKTKLTYEDKKKGVILEKRIKSSNNLELVIFINGIEFYTVDNFMKTNASIDTLGKKLHDLGLINEDELKTDYDYEKYNKDYDMSISEAYEYSKKVFEQLSSDELKYIKNDIIILLKSIIHYSKLYNNFDWNKITFTSNILDYYNDNNLTSYQLLKKVGEGKNKLHLKYTDYVFDNENFYDYLKSFYSGGLNLYNDRYVGKIIYDRVISLDINSSYPYAMHNFKIPTFLDEYGEFENETEINVKINDDTFYLYRMSKATFDEEIIFKIKSRVFRQMLVKYYNKNDFININSYTLRMLKDIMNVDISKLTVLSYVSFKCVEFGSKDKIAKMYEVKEKGSSDYKLIYNSPYDIKVTKEKNDVELSDEEIYISKVILNGLYGIPALRSHFNLFRWVSGELKNINNGYKNNERNIVFSVFVTAVSLYNLLEPLKFLTHEEVDDNFIYCDTDSLYLKKIVDDKIPSTIYHDYHLGKWSKDHDNIEKFYVLNHKKYCYQAYNKKKKKTTIEVMSAGIPKESFNLDMSFENFIKTQFSDGVIVKNQKSIYNKQGTISIYNTETRLEVGKGYRLLAYDELIEEIENEMIEQIKNGGDEIDDDLIYIESNIGTYSVNDVFKYSHEKENKNSLFFLKLFESTIKNMI